jgi:outer membrane protein OmpA-like peptidoglycan-associated protein
MAKGSTKAAKQPAGVVASRDGAGCRLARKAVPSGCPDTGVPAMSAPRVSVTALGLLAALVVVPSLLPAQIGGVIRRAQDRVERKIDRKVDQAVDDAVDCALGDKDCVEKAKADGKPVVIKDATGNVITDANGNPITDQDAAAAAAGEPGTGVWRNYDFVRGDSIWVATDWATERVGRIPASQIEFVEGNLEIVERGGTRLLEAKSSSIFRIKLPAVLPEQFSLEFMIETGAPHISTSVFFGSDRTIRTEAPNDYLHVFANTGIYRRGQAVSSANDRATVGNLTPVKLQVDSAYAIVYLGPTRVAQVPTAQFARTDVIEFHVNANPNFPAYISDIVVAVGLDPLYDKLMANGEVTSYGFLFDVNSDRLRPESTPKLEELREMLAQHGDLRVEIIGHTDATGEDAHNLDLSRRRAQSVVDYLTSNGIGAGRLTAAGKGEAEPVGDNATPSGRQQNRRVVIKKV